MRLIDTATYQLVDFTEASIPPYAILSHKWSDGEVSYQDMLACISISQAGSPDDALPSKSGSRKIMETCRRAKGDRLAYAWIDTCCIDKSSSAELQEAINSMWRWYESAEICYAHLADVDPDCPYLYDSAKDGALLDERELQATQGWRTSFFSSVWFSRGWTLQELIAPKNLHFFGQAWNPIGTKRGLTLTISRTTGIDISVLNQSARLSEMSIAKRMSWAAGRDTTRVEDKAYSLLGIFGVSMPMLYGEGTRAFIRLQEELVKTSTDNSIFAWSSGSAQSGNLFASSPAAFRESARITTWGRSGSYEVTNRGLWIELPTLVEDSSNDTEYRAILNCRYEDDLSGALALRLRQYPGGEQYYVAAGEDNYLGSSELGSERPKSNRLAFVAVDKLSRAEMRGFEITRTFNTSRASQIKFWIRFPSIEPALMSVRPEMYWNPTTRILYPPSRPRVRAHLQLKLSSGRSLVVKFGYDMLRRRKDHAWSDRIIPGLSVFFADRPPWWARSHIGTFDYCIHETPGCQHSGIDECPSTPTTAHVGKRPDPEVIRVEIHKERIMDEDVLILTIALDHFHEMEADSPSALTYEREVSRTGNEGGQDVDELQGRQRESTDRLTVDTTMHRHQDIVLSNNHGRRWAFTPKALIEVTALKQ